MERRKNRSGLHTWLAVAVILLWLRSDSECIIHNVNAQAQPERGRHDILAKAFRQILQADVTADTAPPTSTADPGNPTQRQSFADPVPTPAGAQDEDKIGPAAAAGPPGEPAAQPGGASLLPQAPPPSTSQGGSSPATGAVTAQQSVRLFPAEVTVVYNLPDLQAAIADRKRDIEIRSHLDLRNLPLKVNPKSVPPPDLGISTRPAVGTDLAFLSWPTRSIRGNCTADPSTFTDRAAAELRRLFGALTGDPVPLKPFQCLLLTNANTLFLNDGNGFWLDNLYVGVTQLRSQQSSLAAAVLSAGNRAGVPYNWDSFTKPMNIFLTNITVHGHDEAFSTRIVALTPAISQTSLLFQDSIFVDLAGRDPPFLVASGAYATFSNCLFRNVHLPRSEVFDVSHGGVITLLNCHFSNISTGNGLVDTSYNDYSPFDSDDRYVYEYPVLSSLNGLERVVYGEDDHEAYDIALAPSPEAAEYAYGSDYIVVNETIGDCLFTQLSESSHVLPGCPEESVTERRARANEFRAPGEAGGPPAAWETAQAQYTREANQQEAQREVKRGNSFYDQYYDYDSVDTYAQQPLALYEGSDYSTTQSPLQEYDFEGAVVASLGILLSTEHPWFRAMVETLPRRPPVPAAATAAFRNGLPVCTACSDPPTASLSSLRAANPDSVPMSQAGTKQVPFFVLHILPVTSALCLLAAAVAALYFRHRVHRRNPGEAIGGELQISVRNSHYSVGGAGLGPTAGLHAISMHGSLTEDLKNADFSRRESSEVVTVTAHGQHWTTHEPHWTSHEQPGSAMNPLYEYKLPRGLGLGATDSSEGTETASEVVLHTPSKSYGDKESTEMFTVPSDSDSTQQHMLHHSFRVPAQSGTGVGGSGMETTVTQPSAQMPSQATQVPRMDAGAMPGTDTPVMGPSRLRGMVRQLNAFSRQDLLLGRFELLGPHHRRQGGQAVVQFAVDPRDGAQYAVKFFLQQEAFTAEAALYASCFPHLRTHLSPALISRLPKLEAHLPPPHEHQTFVQQGAADHADTAAASAGDAARMDGDGGGRVNAVETDMQRNSASQATHALHAHVEKMDAAIASEQRRGQVSGDVDHEHDPTAGVGLHAGDRAWRMADTFQHMPDAAAKFLPQVEAVCDNAVDPRGRPLPPCIVMEKGESLQDWSNRAEPDVFASLAVLSNVASRLAVMHAAGYVHRDLKPANVMWLPRENRWTVIGFGCMARIGAVSPVSFTLAYAAPEVVRAREAGAACLEVTAALDAWSLGVIAFELLTGGPAFNFLTKGRAKVAAQLKGELPLPWEEEISPVVVRQLGVFGGPVMQLLQREPSDRVSMDRFHALCSKVFSGQSADAAASV